MTEQEVINKIPEVVWERLVKAPRHIRYASLRAAIVIHFSEKEYSFKRMAIYNILKAELDRRVK